MVKLPKYIPNVVKVGGIRYKVLPVKDLRNENGEKLSGLHTSTQSTIEMCDHDGLGVDETKETLIHECLHALFDAYDLPTTNEEQIVTSLAKGLRALVIDNPKLVGCLT